MLYFKVSFIQAYAGELDLEFSKQPEMKLVQVDIKLLDHFKPNVFVCILQL